MTNATALRRAAIALRAAASRLSAAEDDVVPVAGEGDAVHLDVPLFIRLLEFAREDANNDVDLHDVAEKAISMSKDGTTLSMDQYADLVPPAKPKEDAPAAEVKAAMTKLNRLLKR